MGTSTSYKSGNAAQTDNYVLQNAIASVADEEYMTARKLTGTGVVGDNPTINVDTETFVGQLRWMQPLTKVVNVASVSDATDGSTTNFTSDFLNYVKTVRTSGATKVNMTELVTKEDGLAKYGRDFAEMRAQDEHDALLSVIRGVALSELVTGCAVGSGSPGSGGQTFTNSDTDKTFGFYVDAGSTVKLIEAASASVQGAQRASVLVDALGKGWKDHEPEYLYLIATPAMMASFRAANLVDQDRIVDGNLNIQTMFQGKFRIIPSRANMAITGTDIGQLNGGGGGNIGATTGNTTAYLIKPGAIAMRALNVPNPVEFDRDASKFQGGGITELWNRWGYVLHPAGYDWAGPATDFVTDTQYKNLMRAGGSESLATAAGASATLTGVTGSWVRKTKSSLSLGILTVLCD